jgi:type VI secretion system protein ImpG
LLREYLLLPGRLSFLALDLSAAALEAERVDIAFRFRRPVPAQTTVASDALRINCGPIVNVYANASEPVRPSPESTSQVLRAIDDGPIYAIRSARAVPSRSRQSTSLPAVADAGAEASPLGLAYETFVAGDRLRVAVRAARDGAPPPDLAALSFDLWSTHGTKPQALGIGGVRFAAAGVPPHVTVRNIAPLTPFRPAPKGEALRFRLLAWLALAGKPLASPEALRTVLHVFDLHASATEAGARRAAARRAGILGVGVAPETRSLPRIGVRQGHAIGLRLHGSGFDGEGDLLAFASVADALFAHEASLGRYTRVDVASATSDLTYAFPPRSATTVLE